MVPLIHPPVHVLAEKVGHVLHVGDASYHSLAYSWWEWLSFRYWWSALWGEYPVFGLLYEINVLSSNKSSVKVGGNTREPLRDVLRKPCIQDSLSVAEVSGTCG